MKKIEALKNKETGDYCLYDPKELTEGKDYSKDDYSKTTCLLMEESELKEKIIAFFDDLINDRFPELESLDNDKEGKEQLAEKFITQLLN